MMSMYGAEIALCDINKHNLQLINDEHHSFSCKLSSYQIPRTDELQLFLMTNLEVLWQKVNCFLTQLLSKPDCYRSPFSFFCAKTLPERFSLLQQSIRLDNYATKHQQFSATASASSVPKSYIKVKFIKVKHLTCINNIMQIFRIYKSKFAFKLKFSVTVYLTVDF
jgi:hypothetical protein